MDISQIGNFLFSPAVFLGFCAVIFLLAIAIAFFYISGSAKQEKSREEEKARERESKEKEYAGLINKNAEMASLVDSLKNQIAAQAKEVQEIDRLREELQKKEAAYRTEALTKEKYASDLKSTQEKFSAVQNELKSSQEVYQGLKEQYADLERQVDALNQQIALEKSLYARLKEEHDLCKKKAE